MLARHLRNVILLAAFSVPCLAVAAAPITLAVDATDAPRRLFHARMEMPVASGPLTLMYSKWIPGEHGPTGPITDLAGLRLSCGGKAVEWRRDEVEMYAIHCDVPPGAASLTVDLEYLSPAGEGNFTAGPSATPNITVISWNTLLMYPKVDDANSISFAPSLKLPTGWRFATALDTAGQDGTTITFAPTTLETLIDSPVLAGRHVRRIELTPGQSPLHAINIAGDSEAAIDMPPEVVEQYRRLVAESGALFGARHYLHYDFLLTLSEGMGNFGLEHHQSSDDRLPERTLLDADSRIASGDLLPHEFVHSWNGKHRRPADLATRNPHEPMRTELLWVYEGLTEYLGEVLAARSGLWTDENYRDMVALVAANLEHTPGRTWRPLRDTTVAAQLLYNAPRAWQATRRGVDFYDEGVLIWLEADVMIRLQSGGKRSLDDFCRAFHGGPAGAAPAQPPSVKTYTFDELVTALNDVAAIDWRSFFNARLASTDARPPLDGLEHAGWKVIYNDAPNLFITTREERDETSNLICSLGVSLDKDGTVRDVVPGSPADRAGLGPSMKLVAVNGRKWSPDVLQDALKAAMKATQPIELLMENADFFATYPVEYHGGARYPHLERIADRPDLLTAIVTPRAAPPVAPPPTPAPAAAP